MRACAFSFMRKDTCTPRRSVSTRRYAPIGSANIDIRSFTINYELNTVIYDERIAQELQQDFARDLADCTGVRSKWMR
jgi:phosphatidylserine/phosphatidylglycerophosphate/cardiolipin synthase-like enzyme